MSRRFDGKLLLTAIVEGNISGAGAGGGLRVKTRVVNLSTFVRFVGFMLQIRRCMESRDA
jgi:hypothetical protein